MTRDSERASLLRKVSVFIGFLQMFPEEYHNAQGVTPCGRELRHKMQH